MQDELFVVRTWFLCGMMKERGMLFSGACRRRKGTNRMEGVGAGKQEVYVVSYGARQVQ